MTWIMGSDRALAVTCYDGAGPRTLGSSWFGSDFIPEGWTHAQRFTYLWTELVPVLVFVAIGMSFWWMGRRTRAEEVPDVIPLP